MAKYIFYTERKLTNLSNDNEAVNFQVIGFEEGKTEEEAYLNLKNNIDWVKNADFLDKDLRSKLVFETSFLSKIEKVLNYLWENEERHYEEDMDEDGSVENHIFTTLKEIKSLL